MRKPLLLVLAILLVDQVSKIWVKTSMYYNQDIEIFSWFHIHYIENPGMAFGLEWGGVVGKIMLSLFRLAAIVAIFIWLRKSVAAGVRKGHITAIALILAGAAGNIIDSMLYGMIFDTGSVYSEELGGWMAYSGISEFSFGGYSGFLRGNVVDMLYFPLFSGILPDWVPIWGGEYITFFRPIFNIADSSITIGVFMLLIFQRSKAKKD